MIRAIVLVVSLALPSWMHIQAAPSLARIQSVRTDAASHICHIQWSARRACRTRTVYQADAKHGWADWSAPGWSVENGRLLSNGTEGAIAVPYVPGRHGISDYQVVVKLTVADAPSDEQGTLFAIRARQVGGDSYTLDFTDCDYIPCMTIGELNGSKEAVLKLVSVDDGSRPVQSTLIFLLNGTHLEGQRYDYAPAWEGGGWTLNIRAKDARYRQGGSISLFVAAGVWAVITRVAVKCILH